MDCFESILKLMVMAAIPGSQEKELCLGLMIIIICKDMHTHTFVGSTVDVLERRCLLTAAVLSGLELMDCQGCIRSLGCK